jgi:hypothetical protein
MIMQQTNITDTTIAENLLKKHGSVKKAIEQYQ